MADNKREDYVLLNLEDIAKRTNKRETTTMDIARAIIQASEEGKKPVNFTLQSLDGLNKYNIYYIFRDYVVAGYSIESDLSLLGYNVKSTINANRDGRYYHLTKM